MTRAERMKQKMQIPAEPEQLDGQMSLDDFVDDKPKAAAKPKTRSRTAQTKTTQTKTAQTKATRTKAKKPAQEEIPQAVTVEEDGDAKGNHKLASFYVSDEDLKRYKTFCRVSGVTMSKMIGEAVRQYVDAGVGAFSKEQKQAFDILVKF